MFLIVGLGNPGKSYRNNRHNIGYKIIDNIRKVYDFPEFSKKFNSEFNNLIKNKNKILQIEGFKKLIMLLNIDVPKSNNIAVKKILNLL